MPRDRLPAIPADEMTQEQRAAADEFAATRGEPILGPFVPMLRSPEVMLRAKRMGDYLRFQSSIGLKLNELAILVTAREWTQQFEWLLHARFAREAGLKETIIAAIAEGRRPDDLDADETIVYDFSIELHRTKQVSDATWARAKERFGEQGVIDLSATNGYYSFLAMIMNASRTGLPDGAEEPLRRFP
ncbi:carboxymuconolactone decarboxylase family protein [Terrarubrum flagellatum]|uniref:carboxymuconolactone decarboxylase family protein n=1 Tax=Terrirubrum flagellatum TaxID=2895980 RepID=UPI003144FE1B